MISASRFPPEVTSSHSIPVWLVGRYDFPFHYATPEPLEPGTLVRVPLRKHYALGVVWSTEGIAPFTGPVKPIHQILEHPRLSVTCLKFIIWVATYTLTPIGLILKMVLGFLEGEFKKKDSKRTGKKAAFLDLVSHETVLEPIRLNPEQHDIAEQIWATIASSGFKPCVLEGITGSGKTEVYLSFLQKIKAQQGTTLILLPEIALNTSWRERFKRYFGDDPVVWHSDLTPKQKRDIGHRVLRGDVRVVVGTRSSLFLPFPRLDLIIVDEEHDASYKQDEGVLYHARDMALVRAQQELCPIVLCSATPSFETRYNIEHRGYGHGVLSSRYAGALLPKIELVDLKAFPISQKKALSPPLIEKLHQTFERGEQALLFLNRRGYAPVVFCTHCRQRLSCNQCAAGLTYHQRYRMVVCHHCGTCEPFPEQCPQCQASRTLIPLGLGIEKIAEEARKMFPHARSLIFSSDTAASSRKADQLLQKIHNHDVDLIIGTQMMAKGHHFPLLTCVGVVQADLGLWGCDFRAVEKTYQLIVQVSGRAGRSERQGCVVIQTENPEHPVMQALAQGQWQALWEEEAAQRSLWQWPPFGRLVALILSGTQEAQVEACCQHLTQKRPTESQIRILGPIPAPLSMLRGRYRWRFLVKAPRSFRIQSLLKAWIDPVMRDHPKIKCQIDLDPYTFL